MIHIIHYAITSNPRKSGTRNKKRIRFGVDWWNQQFLKLKIPVKYVEVKPSEVFELEFEFARQRRIGGRAFMHGGLGRGIIYLAKGRSPSPMTVMHEVGHINALGHKGGTIMSRRGKRKRLNKSQKMFLKQTWDSYLKYIAK